MATRSSQLIRVTPGVSIEGAVSVREVGKTGRVQRRPSNPFYIHTRPHVVQPFVCHPVLPGETMKNALLQVRCVTDPVKNPLVGWWNEYYLFYVKLTDLVEVWPAISDMLLKNVAPAETFPGDAKPEFGYHHGGFSYYYACAVAVIRHYFRDEGEELIGSLLDPAESFLSGAGGGLLAKVQLNNALQSLVLDSDTPQAEDEELPGQIYPADLPTHLSQFEAQYDQWKELTAMRMTAATFEDWLAQFGVRVPREQREELHIPELIRYIREFSYPSNTVNAADGSVASALSWSIAERADKDRYFAEPGFIFGVTVTRPKVYLGKQVASATNFMTDAFSWLPAVMDQQPYTSLKKFNEAEGDGPIADLAGDYWLDQRDLLLYGEQFSNVIAGGDIPKFALPTDSADTELPLNRQYPSSDDLNGLFADVAANKVRMDGRIDFTILGRQTDATP